MAMPNGKWLKRGGLLALTLAASAWGYLAYTNTRHVYNLMACAAGQTPLLPAQACLAYFYAFRGTPDDVAQIQFDGALPSVLSPLAQEDRRRAIAFLLSKGLDINGRDGRTGMSALHAAVLGNEPALVALLLEYGADPDVKDAKRSMTPLEHAQLLAGKPGQPDRSEVMTILRSARRGA